MSARKPNFIFVMTDEQNLRGLSCYKGTVCKTPTVDRMAREGALFENAYCAYPVCMPSRAAFMTGRFPHVNGVRCNGIALPENEISLPQIFKEAGYTTALCGKDHCFSRPDRLDKLFDFKLRAMHFGLYAPLPEDFPAGAEEANRYYTETLRPKAYNPFGHGVIPFDPGVCDAGLITEAAVRFIRGEAAGDSPFFMWLSYPGPHWPFTCPAKYVDTVPPDNVDMPPRDELEAKPPAQAATRRILGLENTPEDDFRKIISLYYGNCRYIDDQLSRVFALLEELGIREDTIICFTSDHGDYLGEHGLMHKSPTVYDCLTKIPFIWWWPGHIAPGQRCAELVEAGVDLAPTIYDLCGIQHPPGMQGISLARALLGQESYPERDACFCEVGIEESQLTPEDIPDNIVPESPYERWALEGLGHRYWGGRVKMVRSGKWKLGYYERGGGELYDLEEDPWELHNLYDSPGHREIVAALKEKLLQWMMKTENNLPPLRSKAHKTKTRKQQR